MKYFDLKSMKPNRKGKTGKEYLAKSSNDLAGWWLIGCRKIKFYKVVNEASETNVENTRFQFD